MKGRILPRLGHLRLQAVTGGHLNGLYRELEDEGLSPASRRLTHAVLSRTFRDAVRWGRLVRNPAAAADPPAAAESRATALTARELGRFLEQVKGDRLLPLWRLAATTGMRRGELLGLTWLALDLEGGTLRVDQQLVPNPRRRQLRAAEVQALTPEDRARRRDGRDAADAPRGAATRAGLRRRQLHRPRPRLLRRARRSDQSDAADRGIPTAPKGRRHPDRDASRLETHAHDARAFERRSGPRRRGSDRRPP
jgi:integrase